MRAAVLAVVSAGLWISTVLAQTPDMAGDQQKFDQAAAAYDAANYEEAYKIFLDLAEHNDIAAMRNVALMKRKGEGTNVDLEGARDFLERASEAGLPTAQYDLALMMLNGEGGDPDPKSAVRLLESAAGAHHPFAALRLGELYEEGKLVPQDLAKAELLYTAAAERGVKDAEERLSVVKAMVASSSGSEPAKADSQTGPDAKGTPVPDSTGAIPNSSQTKVSLTGGFVLQIGAYRSEVEAIDSWRVYKAAHPQAAEFEPDIRQADLPTKGKWYRLQIGPFASAADAKAFCMKLKANGGACFPVKTVRGGS